MSEVSLDPGIDQLYAVKTIDEVHDKGGKVKRFLSYCGGSPLQILFVFSRSSALSLLNSASFYANGGKIIIDDKDLMVHAKPYYIAPAYTFVACPNRDSTPFKQFYNKDIIRVHGFPEFSKTLVELAWAAWLNADI
ncbi:hypothetical protein AX14_001457 [Amanita brunnescens Koide BX004]|nr:hypothetical protein AX14_001457 [Amanita brunnescens Koide BX004]